jgi:hypothetical protein
MATAEPFGAAQLAHATIIDVRASKTKLQTKAESELPPEGTRATFAVGCEATWVGPLRDRENGKPVVRLGRKAMGLSR